MTKARTTFTIDSDVMKVARVRATRSGNGDSEVIEDAVRRSLGLDLFGRMWKKSELDGDQAMALAVEAQHEGRAV